MMMMMMMMTIMMTMMKIGDVDDSNNDDGGGGGGDDIVGNNEVKYTSKSVWKRDRFSVALYATEERPPKVKNSAPDKIVAEK